MNIKEDFSHFLDLGQWSPGNISRPDKLRDYYLEPYVLIRKYSGQWKVCYLYSSDIITIPESWVSLFSDYYSWTDLDWITDKMTDNIETVIKEFALFCGSLMKQTRTSYVPKESDALQNLRGALRIGTKELREWLLDGWKIELEPLRFDSFSGSLEI